MEQVYKILNEEYKSIDSGEKSIKHWISKSNIDRDGDILLPELIDDTNYKMNPVVLFNHISHSDKVTVIGKSMWRKVEDGGYLTKTLFANTSLASELFELYKERFMTSWSIGFLPKENPTPLETGGYKFGKIEMLEYSAVTIPANPEAISLSFIKDLKSEELQLNFLNDYILKGIVDDVEILKQHQLGEFITKSDFNLYQNDVKTKIDTIYNKMDDIVGDISFVKDFKKEMLLKEIKKEIAGAILHK